MPLGLLDPNRIEVYGDCQYGPLCVPKRAGERKLKCPRVPDGNSVGLSRSRARLGQEGTISTSSVEGANERNGGSE